MPTQNQLQAIALYANLMEEVKIRIDSLNIILGSNIEVPGQIIREFCLLQLRMLCELIALGCLVAHGDIKEASRLKDEWKADRIIERLEALHPEFYPWPIKQTKTGSHHKLEIIDSGFLTKSDLLKLYREICGNALHKGSLKKLLSSKTPIQTNHQDIINWGQKIQNLLSNHGFFLLDRSTLTLCMLRNIDDNNRVQVAIAEQLTAPSVMGYEVQS